MANVLPFAAAGIALANVLVTNDRLTRSRNREQAKLHLRRFKRGAGVPSAPSAKHVQLIAEEASRKRDAVLAFGASVLNVASARVRQYYEPESASTSHDVQRRWHPARSVNTVARGRRTRRKGYYRW